MPSASALSRGGWGLERKAQERSVSVSSPSGLECRAALPILCASAPRLKSISLAHPPSLINAVQPALQVRARLTTVFSFRYPRGSGLATLVVLYEGSILAVVYDELHSGMDLLGRGAGILIFTYFLSFPPASLSLHAIFQTLRRHRYRLLRQRLFSFPPSQTCMLVLLCLCSFVHVNDLQGSCQPEQRVEQFPGQ